MLNKVLLSLEENLISCRADKDSYPHDGRADKGRYRHDSCADKNPYRHDRRADSLSRTIARTSVFGVSNQVKRKTSCIVHASAFPFTYCST